MLHNFTVSIPVAKGKISKQKTKSGTYIHYVMERTYNAKKKFTAPKRTVIGKVHPKDEKRMFPNERFFEFFPQAEIPQAHQEADSKRSSALQVGAYLIIESVIKEYGLDQALAKHFGGKAGLLLDLAAYMIVEGRNQGQYYPDYAYHHPLFTEAMKMVGDSTVSKFLASVEADQITGFLNDWNDKRDHASRIYVSYDSTNKNSQAGDIDFVEFGKAKDEKGLPIFNISVAFDNTNRIPLFYEQYPGSINDVSQFKHFVDKALSYNYRNIGFILDRGYFSKSNIEYMDQNGYQFVMMVKGCKELVATVIDEHRGSFEHLRDTHLAKFRIHGTTVKRPLFAGDTKDRYLHLYFNADRMSLERKELEEKLGQMADFLRQSENKQINFSRPYTDYFELHYDSDGVFLFAEEKKEVSEQELLRCGYFCLVTSEKMTALDAYALYKGRDTSEKLFCADKTFLGSKSMRVQTKEAVSAKVFIEFVALIIRNRIYNLLKEQMLKLPVRKNYLTVPAAIRELEKIEIVSINKNAYQLDHALTKNQKQILASFGISATDVQARISEMAAVLSKSNATSVKADHDEDIDNDEDDIEEGLIDA